MFQNKLVFQGIPVIGVSAAQFSCTKGWLNQRIKNPLWKIEEALQVLNLEKYFYQYIYCFYFVIMIFLVVVVVVTVLIPFLKGTKNFKFGKGNR